MALLEEVALADQAHEAALVVVCAVLVGDEIGLLRVALRAAVAGEGANARVHAAVDDHVALGEHLPTIRARDFLVVARRT